MSASDEHVESESTAASDDRFGPLTWVPAPTGVYGLDEGATPPPTLPMLNLDEIMRTQHARANPPAPAGYAPYAPQPAMPMVAPGSTPHPPPFFQPPSPVPFVAPQERRAAPPPVAPLPPAPRSPIRSVDMMTGEWPRHLGPARTPYDHASAITATVTVPPAAAPEQPSPPVPPAAQVQALPPAVIAQPSPKPTQARIPPPPPPVQSPPSPLLEPIVDQEESGAEGGQIMPLPPTISFEPPPPPPKRPYATLHNAVGLAWTALLLAVMIPPVGMALAWYCITIARENVTPESNSIASLATVISYISLLIGCVATIGVIAMLL